jgi:iron(III) transport system permease protein
LNQPGSATLNYLYDRTIFAPWLAIVVRALPVAIVVLWHAFRTAPVELVEAATLEGAGPLRRLLYVGLPLRWPAVLAALLAALAVGLGELSASVMVLPPGVSTVAFRVFDLLHTGYEDRVAGLCLSLVLTFASLTALVVWLSQKHRSS